MGKNIKKIMYKFDITDNINLLLPRCYLEDII